MPRRDPYGAGGRQRQSRPSASSDRLQDGLNAAIRAARDLKTSQGRREQGKYLLEGVRLVEDALDQGVSLDLAFVTPHLLDSTPRGRALAQRLRAGEMPIFEVGERLLTLVADTDNPAGVVAVATQPPAPTYLPAPWTSGLQALLLDQLRDPGNVGAILRTAGAAGVGLIATTEGSVDLWAPKVVRAGAGAHQRLDLCPGRPYDEVADWLDGWPLILLADGRARTPIYEVDWRRPCVLILGNEAHGPSTWGRDLRILPVRIPMRAATESLNVAAAAAVLLYEARRQALAGQ